MRAWLTIAAVLAVTGVASAWAAVAVEAEAPAFELPAADGSTVSLADFAGKIVVLEWINYDCPFVKKHYGEGNMQRIQKAYTDRGVVWLAICSSAPGKQGHYLPEELGNMAAEQNSPVTAVLSDPDGAVGRLYGAKTTPHLFVIDAEGRIAYQGAIDNMPTANPRDIETADNYVEAALDALLDGNPVEIRSSAPYGCSVKY